MIDDLNTFDRNTIELMKLYNSEDTIKLNEVIQVLNTLIEKHNNLCMIVKGFNKVIERVNMLSEDHVNILEFIDKYETAILALPKFFTQESNK